MKITYPASLTAKVLYRISDTVEGVVYKSNEYLITRGKDNDYIIINSSNNSITTLDSSYDVECFLTDKGHGEMVEATNYTIKIIIEESKDEN